MGRVRLWLQRLLASTAGTDVARAIVAIAATMLSSVADDDNCFKVALASRHSGYGHSKEIPG